MSKKSELKRCPLCGGSTGIDYYNNGDDWYVFCNKCHCTVHSDSTDSDPDPRENVIAKWNKRV